jgi:oligoribonuclease
MSSSVQKNDRLVWIDCEMTGLDLEVDELCEIAVFVTDAELNVLDEKGLDVVIKPSQAALDNMGDFVTNMHRTSGLADEIPNGVDVADAQRQVLEYVRQFVPAERTAPLAGNTIGTDRMFLAKQMPELDGYLHYRNVDVSTLKELARRWYPRVYFQAPEKHGGHRAAADILESIRELRYYRAALIVADPGPDSDSLKVLSQRIVDEFAPLLES